MTQDEIIEMACQAFGGVIKQEERANFIAFAKLIAKKQAKECEFLCEELWRKGGWEHNAGFAATCIRKKFLNDDS